MDGWLPQGAFVQFLRRPSGQDGDKEWEAPFYGASCSGGAGKIACDPDETAMPVVGCPATDWKATVQWGSAAMPAPI
jgi:hypothetical protein